MKEAFDQKQIDDVVEKFNKKEDPSQQQIIDSVVNKFNKKPENNLIESIKLLTPEKRVLKLIELGFLRDLEGYQWGCLGGDRFYIFANINGVPVPMYKSSAYRRKKIRC